MEPAELLPQQIHAMLMKHRSSGTWPFGRANCNCSWRSICACISFVIRDIVLECNLIRAIDFMLIAQPELKGVRTPRKLSALEEKQQK